MRSIFIMMILVSSSAFAGLRHLGVQNLTLDYTAPKGSGSVEKIDIGLSKFLAHPLEVERIAETLVVTTPMLNFTWIEPWKFLLDAEKVSLVSATVDAHQKKLDATVAQAKLSLNGDYGLTNATVHCEGTSDLPDLDQALLEDCRENLAVEADRFDVPIDLALIDVLSKLPQPDDEERPLKNFTLSVKDGEFYMYFLAQVVVKAGLRAWGEMHYEDNLKILVIRVDLIKFGYLPVTSIVMKKLQEAIKDPHVKIEPPFIRFQLRD